MNLILSDVEETIMIVDPEAAEQGQSVVNVRLMRSGRPSRLTRDVPTGREAENGHAFR